MFVPMKMWQCKNCSILNILAPCRGSGLKHPQRVLWRFPSVYYNRYISTQRFLDNLHFLPLLPAPLLCFFVLRRGLKIDSKQCHIT